MKVMTLGQFRKLTEKLPDNAPFNYRLDPAMPDKPVVQVKTEITAKDGEVGLWFKVTVGK